MSEVEASRERALDDAAATPPGDRPLIKAPRARFPVSPEFKPAALAADLASTLDHFVEASGDDPYANPVLDLSLEIVRRLEGGSLDYGALEQTIQYLSVEGFLHRGRAIGRWLGEVDTDANAERIRALFRTIALPAGAGEPIPFETFRAAIEREIVGIVITAHPTFNLSSELMALLASLATGRTEDGAELDPVRRADIVRRVSELEHRPDSEMTLAREHEMSLIAIANIQAALRQVYALIYDVVAEIYPEHWSEVSPRLLTVASWVGYDLDGRSDIRWTDTLHKRLKVQKAQLLRYIGEIKAITAEVAGQDDELRHTLEQAESRIALAIREVSEELEVFADHDPDGPEAYSQIQRISRRMHEGQPYRLIDSAYLIERLNRAIRLICPSGQCISDDIRRLCVLRAELAALGLGMAHTHVRLNSTQIHNAIRKAVGLETEPDDPRYRQSYLERITQLLDKVTPVSINFGSLIAERTSAKRLFMVVAQMLKYADATIPVRFLIAESDATFTVLAALYYARLFGIADRLDISPLFETERAMEVGSRTIDQLLENPHYRAYVEQRGRLCIQTGYSDAGRYLGQTPAAASIERLRNRVADLFLKHGLENVQLVVFDTHGESIGRGSHPASVTSRLSYIAPPAWLQYLSDRNIPFKQEISFQGGDGYLPFATPVSAFAVITRILEYFLGPREGGKGDPFYDERDYVKEFYSTVVGFQNSLVEDPKYAALIQALGPGLLFPSGSRPVKRQYDGTGASDQPSVTQIRAIPHNAILQQLGLPANSIGGLGLAIERDPERYASLYSRSRRFRELMGIVEYGSAIADPDALKAMIAMLDPELWLRLAARAADPSHVYELRLLARLLEQQPTHGRQMLVFRKLYRDFTILKDGLDRTGAGCGGLVSERSRRGLRLLHAIRLALIQEIFRLATHIPDFSNQYGTTRERVISLILHLDVPAAVTLLKRIFPATSDAALEGDFGETATYRSDDNQNYRLEHLRLFQPMSGLYELVLRTGGAITQRIGFLG